MVGKPLSLHGSYGREYATGRGVVLAARELLKAEHAGRLVDKEVVLQVRLRGGGPVQLAVAGHGGGSVCDSP